MGIEPCCSKSGLKRRPWTAEEDEILREYIRCHGPGNWRRVPLHAGLNRCGKSCRLRWINYLPPDIKRGNFSEEEEDLIVRLHNLLGNRWSLIARRIPGRTDNEIKNYWNTRLSVRRNDASTQNKKILKPKAGKPSSSKDTTLPIYSSFAGPSAAENLSIKAWDSNGGTSKEMEESSSYRSSLSKSLAWLFESDEDFMDVEHALNLHDNNCGYCFDNIFSNFPC